MLKLLGLLSRFRDIHHYFLILFNYEKFLQIPNFFIGIDVSKLTLDVTVLCPSASTKKYKQIANTVAGLNVLNSWLRKIDGFKYPHALFCLEHTGVYTRGVLSFFSEKSADICLESSLYIIKSVGLKKGKNDKIDSLRIAEYAYRFIDKAELY